MAFAPIVLFVYKRLWHTQQVVEALLQNPEASQSDLFIYSDGPKPGVEEDVKKLREYLKTIKGFKKIEIIERKTNYGLANNIIDGITKIVDKYEKIIVLEDDLVVSPGFLHYMNKGLEIYKNEEKVASIHGYVYPLKKWYKLPQTFFIRGADCWGWGTWQRAWNIFEPDGRKLKEEILKRKEKKLFDMGGTYPYFKMLEDQINGKNNSWAIRWYASAFLHNKLTLYPHQSLVKNIGFDKSGTHCQGGDVFSGNEIDRISPIKTFPEENPLARKMFENYLRWLPFSIIIKRVKERIKI